MTAERGARWIFNALLVFTVIYIITEIPEAWVRPLAFAGAIWSALVGHAFVIIYWWRSQWWKSSIGRHLMSFMGGLTAIIDLTLINAFVPGLLNRSSLTLFVWVLIPLLFTWRLWILIFVRHYDKNGNARH